MGVLDLLDALEAELALATREGNEAEKDERIWNARSIAVELRTKLDRDRPPTGEWERLKRDE
jgi:hypothetical protein